MSWKGFTKAVGRLPAMIAKSTGGIQETKDQEFLHFEEQFKLLDTLARTLSDDTRKFKDSLSLMLHHQAELARLFTLIYAPLGFKNEDSIDDSNPVTRPALEFATAMNQAKDSLQSDLLQLERLVVAPTIDFIAILDTIKRYLVKRSHKLLDFDRHGDSVKSMREKANRTVNDEKKLSQLEATFDQAARDYNSINNQLKADLAVFLDMRKDFIDPCLLTFYNYQVRVYETLYRIYYQVGSSQFDLSSTALPGYQHVQEELVNMLNTLSVCKGIARPAAGIGSEGSHSAGPPASTSTYSQQLAQQKGMAGALVAAPSNQTRSSYDGSATARPLSTDISFNDKRPQSLDTGLKNYVVALYDFEPQAEGDLGFKKNDKIEVIARTEDLNDWWTGRIGDRVGAFPGNYTAGCSQ